MDGLSLLKDQFERFWCAQVSSTKTALSQLLLLCIGCSQRCIEVRLCQLLQGVIYPDGLLKRGGHVIAVGTLHKFNR